MSQPRTQEEWIEQIKRDVAGSHVFIYAKGEKNAAMCGFSHRVMAIFDQPQTVVAAWLHYLIFDLFVGAWEVRDAARRGVPHLWVAPCLLLTFLFGPLGLLAYLSLRAIRGGGLGLAETEVRP